MATHQGMLGPLDTHQGMLEFAAQEFAVQARWCIGPGGAAPRHVAHGGVLQSSRLRWCQHMLFSYLMSLGDLQAVAVLDGVDIL